MKQIQKTLIEKEMKQSYLDYAMSVIVSRALPDVRDGLKPVHRRILYAMYKIGLFPNKAFKKSAHVIGQVLSAYHPHGDMAVYDALVRMAQDFSLRYPLVNGQGNWGDISGYPAAAYRYCVTGDTLVLTDKGIMPIKEISKKEDINIKILNYKGKKKKASKLFDSGIHDIIRMVTSEGYELRGTYNHPVLCWCLNDFGFPTLKWKLLSEINEGDYILMNRNFSLFSKKNLNLVKYYPKMFGKHKNVRLPKQMNKDLAFLLGALVAEGSFHNNQILFNNSNLNFYDHIKKIIEKQFKGIKLYERKIKGKCLELSISNQKVVRFLINIGLKKCKSHLREIPFSILQSNKKNIRQFLIALFEGDGSILFRKDKRHNGKTISLTYDSKSYQLIQQLKILLLNFGIITTSPYIDKRSYCYKIYVSSCNNVKIFRKEIGFFSKRKKEILNKVKYINKDRMSKLDFIPYLNGYLKRNYKENFIHKHNLDRYNKLEKYYYKLKGIIKEQDKKIIKWLLKNRLFFNKVKIIKKLKTKERVYSVKVESNCHSFIANGFINHNTECRLKKISEDILNDLEKDTVDFIPNFDNSTKEPTVLPCKVPNLLINGSSGIAVGMATNIPPHNISEVIEGVVRFIDNNNISVEELFEVIKGPDFPTGGLIYGRSGILEAYKTGRGKINVRARVEKEEGKLVVKEIPYMINKTSLIESIAELVKEKKVEGIRDIRDESDRKGMRIVIEVRRGFDSDVVLNKLMRLTSLSSSFGIIMLGLVNGEPKILSLKDMISEFVLHRKAVVVRRSGFELKNAEERAHVLEGLKTALGDIDGVVGLIKKALNVAEAMNGLVSNYNLSEKQANAILDMKLQRLTSLETEKLNKEYDGLLVLIKELKELLGSDEKIFSLIKEELAEMREKYKDERRTEIVDIADEVEKEDLVQENDVVVTVTKSGYIKQVGLELYKQQKRGGVGIKGTGVKEEDVVKNIFVTSNLNYLLFFTNKGKVHWLKAYEVPEAGRYSKGKAIINLLRLKEDEKVNSVLPVKEFKEEFIVFATKKGLVKKTSLKEFSKPRQGGILAINLKEGDEVVQTRVSPGNLDFVLGTKKGLSVRFNEADIGKTGRVSRGVRGIRLSGDDEVVGMEVAFDDAYLFTITENGYGKRTSFEEYHKIRRGGKGVKNILVSKRNGGVVGVKTVLEDDELILVSERGVVIRVGVKDISCIGRATQGFRVMRLKDGDKVAMVARVV